MLNKDLLAALGVGLTFILAVSTLMGGILVWGIWVAGAVVIATAWVVIIKILFDRRAQRRPHETLTRVGFTYPEPSWLSATDKDQLYDLAKAAFVLLLLEQTESGCWSKTYLYRHRFEPLPFSHGALTGTPFALIALSSIAGAENSTLQPIYQPLFETLARVVREDGNYLKRYTTVSMMGPGPEYEKPRHAAGACLCKLVYGAIEPPDLKTIENMCLQRSGLESYDKAMLSRLLLQTIHVDVLPKDLRKQSGKRLNELLELLETSGRRPTAAHIWAQDSSLQHDSTNQWGTVWWILPSLVCQQIPLTLRTKLAERLRHFLLAQSAAEVTKQKLLPTEIDQTGQGTGICVFGSGVALVAWRTLEKEKIGDEVQATAQGKYMVQRLIRSRVDAIEAPAISEPPQILEGYLGWAALCLGAASLGIPISSIDCRAAVSLVQAFKDVRLDNMSNKQLELTYKTLIDSQRLLSPRLAEAVARVAARIAVFYSAVPKWANTPAEVVN